MSIAIDHEITPVKAVLAPNYPVAHNLALKLMAEGISFRYEPLPSGQSEFTVKLADFSRAEMLSKRLSLLR